LLKLQERRLKDMFYAERRGEVRPPPFHYFQKNLKLKKIKGARTV
jgi:hypothetical protein